VFSMPSASRSVVIGTRATCETKANFAALAAREGLSESALLALLVEKVVAQNSTSIAPAATCEPALARPEDECAKDRLTLRLRPGDRALADARAAARRMKTASYLSMLIRTRGASVMPPTDLDELKALAGQLAAIGRKLRQVRAADSQPGASSCSDALLGDIGRLVESVREAVAGVVRAAAFAGQIAAVGSRTCLRSMRTSPVEPLRRVRG
jgi:hypothetical protein